MDERRFFMVLIRKKSPAELERHFGAEVDKGNRGPFFLPIPGWESQLPDNDIVLRLVTPSGGRIPLSRHALVVLAELGDKAHPGSDPYRDLGVLKSCEKDTPAEMTARLIEEVLVPLGLVEVVSRGPLKQYCQLTELARKATYEAEVQQQPNRQCANRKSDPWEETIYEK